MKKYSLHLFALIPTLLSAQNTFLYNSAGNLKTIQKLDGPLIQFEYDGLNRIKKITKRDPIEFDYDRTKNSIKMTDIHGETLLQYNKMNQVVSVSYPNIGTLQYIYDSQGKLKQVNYPNGFFVFYSYDIADRVKSVISPHGIVTYTYDPLANTLSKIKYPNGVNTEFEYDSSMRLASTTHKKPNKSLIEKFEYKYDNNGNKKQQIISRNGKSVTVRYEYDKVDRLVLVEYPDHFEKFTYDELGNRLTRESEIGEFEYKYKNNQLTSVEKTTFFYENGNLIKKTTPEKTVLYAYNENDDLIRYEDGKNTVVYEYDGFGRRISKVVNGEITRFVNDVISSETQVLMELDERNGVKAEYVYGLSRISARAGNELLFYLSDSLSGSPVTLSDCLGNVKHSYEYTAFGFPTNYSESDPNHFLFRGEHFEPETGLIYLRNRYYDPDLGRFISKDPQFGNPFNPQSLNPYVYANNNPINYVDPLGLKSATVVVYPPGTKLADGSRSKVGHGYWVLESDNGLKDRPGRYPGGLRADGEPPLGSIWHTFPATDEQIDNILAEMNRGCYIGVAGNCIDGLERGLKVLGIKHPSFSYYGISCPMKALQWIESLNGRNDYTEWYREHLDFFMDTENRFPPSPFDVNKLPPIPDSLKGNSNFQSGSGLSSSGSGGDVGGVSLNKTAHLFGLVNDIHGVVYDTDTSELILLGEKNVSLPAMDFDDFAVAVKSVYGLEGNIPEDPGVSIDWNPANTAKIAKGKYDQLSPMPVRYMGKTEGTHFGQVMFEADRLLKSLSLGLDNMTLENIHPPISFYQSLPSLYTSYRQLFSGEMTRMWFVPKEISLVASPDGRAMEFTKVELEVKTENRHQNGQTVRDPVAEQFAEHFTNHFDEFAKHYPVLGELKKLGKITGVVKWVKDHNLPLDLSIFEKYTPKFYSTAYETPATSFPGFIGGRILNVVGGVIYHIDSNNFHEIQHPAVKSLQDMALFQRPKEDDFSWEVTGGNFRGRYIAVSHPLQKTQKTGNVVKRFIDMTILIPGKAPFLLTRTYNSFSTTDIGLGVGWSFASHVLHFPSHKSIFHASETAHPLTLYSEIYVDLDTPYKLIGLDSRLCPVYQGSNSTIFIKYDNGLYSFSKNGKERLIFNEIGQLITEIDPEGTKVNYEYEGSSLKSLTHSDGPKIIFEYQGSRISKAITQHQEIAYSYNSGNQLESVSDAMGLAASYEYDEDTNINQIKNAKGNVVFEASYDLYHRAKSTEENCDSHRCAYSLKDRMSKISSGSLETQNRYDSKYRLLESSDSLDRSIKFSYDSKCEKLSKMIDPLGNEFQCEYYDNGHLSKISAPEEFEQRFWYYPNGQVAAVLAPSKTITAYQYDSRGRIEKIWNQATLIRDDVVSWEFSCHPEFLTELKYDPDSGKVSSVIEKGQVKKMYTHYPNGSVHSMTDPLGYVVKYEYDDLGRVKTVSDSSGKRSLEYSYNPRNQILTENSPSGIVIYTYDKAGNLESLTNRNGYKTTFNYDDHNRLSEVIDAEGKITQYKHPTKEEFFIEFPNKTQKSISMDVIGRVAID